MNIDKSHRRTCSIKWHFHWDVRHPKKCCGGPVYFGWWATVNGPDGDVTEQSAGQVRIKQDMGII